MKTEVEGVIVEQIFLDTMLSHMQGTMIHDNQLGFTNDRLFLTNLVDFYDTVTASAGRGRTSEYYQRARALL